MVERRPYMPNVAGSSPVLRTSLPSAILVERPDLQSGDIRFGRERQHLLHAPVTQWKEYRPSKPRVARSSRAGCAI